MSDIDELRAAVAAEHRLPEGAMRFLNATTLAELERQADALARLIERSGALREQEQAEPLADILANAAAEKMRRKAALVEALHGRPEQPRDEHGRYATFDGGARANAVPQSPEQAHDEIVVQMAQLSRAYGRRI